MRKSQLAAGLIAIAALSLSLASCAPSQPFSDVPTATLPAAMEGKVGAPIKDSVRLLGEDSSGTSYYVGTWAEKQGETCLLIVKASDQLRTCSATLPITAVFAGKRATLDASPASSPAPDGSELVGKYLLVRS
ncbi:MULTISPECIES: hypothetical protein [Bacteria]|uniref:hypothetical protein n=1 Tax=Bacteria TaxID=2 RepID=UPI0018CCE59A|nr:hypothetical protein [Bacillus toyonensis]